MFPPKRSRILLETSLSRTACLRASRPEGSLPCSRSRLTSRPVSLAALKSFCFRPPSPSIIIWMRAYAFSKMRGAAPMKVGFTTARLSTILSIRPSMAVVKPICSGSVRRFLPKKCASGSQRYWTSVSSRMLMASVAAPSKIQQLCGSRTPLGRPVVPEV